jgi:catechol 2,3-dioxygenase-like lactoylglutathione lyase family enzyme
MEMKLEVVMLPVADVQRSLDFYKKVGFVLDHDVQPGNGMRVIQLTPPGSACSIVFGTGMGNSGMTPGDVKNMHLVVEDIQKAQQTLIDRGVEVSEINDMGGIKYAYFQDPDGNSLALQEISSKKLN